MPRSNLRSMWISRVSSVAILWAAFAAVAPARGAEIELPLSLEDPTRTGKFRVERSDGVLHLVFFATWCPPCVEEFPRLSELEARWGDRGYRLVLVAVPTRQSRERLAQLIAHEGPPGRVGFDAAGSVQKACGVEDLPTHLLVDSAGKVILRSSQLNGEVERAVSRVLERER